jgi:hypothetical protein
MRASSSSRRYYQGRHLVFDRLESRLLLSMTSPQTAEDGTINSQGIENQISLYSEVASDVTVEAAAEPTSSGPRQMENLNRGIIAVRSSSSQVYIGWRLLGLDPSNIAFNIYRSANGATAVKLNGSPITQTTNFVDTTANLAQNNSYYVRPVIGGVEQTPSESYTLAANAPVQQYLSIPLNIPDPVVTADGVTHTYSANDASVGDLDGDGQYEIVLKWDPDPQDTWQQTGNVYFDAYEMDGTQLWRIDLGLNIRAGAPYTNFTVYDLDGDGKAEVVSRTADGTISGTGQIIGNPTARWWRDDGRIVSGPEYFTIFEGSTGRALVTTNYDPPRAVNPANGSTEWGDNYGHRSDTFGQCVAYLDGIRPSLVMTRGIYYPQPVYPWAKMYIVAWNWRDGELTKVWSFHGALNQDGNINSEYVGQGNHNLSVGDVDLDGKDEIIYGACAIDDDGTGMYSTGLGHGDAMHLSDMDPSRPGLEVFDIHEDPGAYGPNGGEFRNAATGTVYFGIDGHGGDVGRGNAFDIDPNYPGFESWTATTWLNEDGSTNYGYIYNAQGNPIYAKPSNMFINFGIWWDADLGRELLDGTTISEWNYTTHGRQNLVYAPANVTSNNSTKKTPCLSADILGDWREEVIWRRSDNTALQIWTTTIPATNRIYTLMHDPQYRLSIAWQNVAYNQPPHTGFYLGFGMSTPPTPNIYYPAEVAGRMVFYNNSKFDILSDDNSIATNKQALLPGQVASFANYTSYSRGINGIMVDIRNLANPAGLTADDFQFKVGNDDNPAGWTTVPAPTDFTVRQNAGLGGSYRVMIIWADNATENQWLQVTVKANTNTGLAGDDVFYFGNTVGESGNDPANAVVNLDDELASRTHKTGFAAAAITNHYDYNRDGKVNATDDLLARHNVANPTLQLINPPVGGPLAASDNLQPISARVETETSSSLLTSNSSPLPSSSSSSFPRSGVVTQFYDALRLENTAGYSLLPDTATTIGTLNIRVPTLERWNQEKNIRVPTLEHGNQEMLERGNQEMPSSNNGANKHLAKVQIRLKDAVFSGLITRHSLAEISTDWYSTTQADVETLIRKRLPDKDVDYLSKAIDTVLDAFISE